MILPPTESVSLRVRSHEGRVHAMVEQIWSNPGWKLLRLGSAPRERGWLPTGDWPEPAERGKAYELPRFPADSSKKAGTRIILVRERRVTGTLEFDSADFTPTPQEPHRWAAIDEISCLATGERLADGRNAPIMVWQGSAPDLLVLNCPHEHAPFGEFANLALHAMMSGENIFVPGEADSAELWVQNTGHLHSGARIRLTLLRPLAWCEVPS